MAQFRRHIDNFKARTGKILVIIQCVFFYENFFESNFSPLIVTRI